jgi:7-cyano-7-deazaguanine synthase in queuosine biosynthesis
MTTRVIASVYGIREAFPVRKIQFSPGREFALRGSVGAAGLSPAAADLLDLATSVYWIERSLPGHRSANTPKAFDLSIRLREPERWSDATLASLSDALQSLGNAEWRISVERARRAVMPRTDTIDRQGVSEVAMLSGGLDSTCGAAHLQPNSDRVQLVSYYTKQRTVQQQIAGALRHTLPAQFWLEKNVTPGRGRAFYYRSFFFTTIAAAIADSFESRRILQYENGILATAIPPSPSWRMTRHAHPATHRALERVFGGVLGGQWRIDNPFFERTKREALADATQVVGKRMMQSLVSYTDTCWYHWSNNIAGSRKPPGIACGVCIPCIVRRTAVPDDRFHLDLRRDRVRNHEIHGRAFRSYGGFARDLLLAKKSDAELYRKLPAAAHELIRLGFMKLLDLARLFRAFATEFEDTFGV